MATERSTKEIVVVPNILGYELNNQQYLLSKHLIPAIGGCIFYILHFAGDVAVIYRHYREDNHIWASLTLFFIYLPVLGCYVLTITCWELWPVYEGCGWVNLKWFTAKTLQHLLFPVWSMWRCAENIFWSVEGVRAACDEEREEIIATLNSPRTIELYYFLQGYLQGLPQAILQLHILMRYFHDLDMNTVNAQALSIVLSLATTAWITTQYQRFKTQNLGGRGYPWHKRHKISADVVDSPSQRARIVYRCKRCLPKDFLNEEVVLRRSDDPDPSSRRSSDYYEQPTSSYQEKHPSSFHENPTNSYYEQKELGRETSVVDGPKRLVLKYIEDILDRKPKRLREVKSMSEDNIVGKIIAFLWWFCFLLARVLVISFFAYFYFKDALWVLCCHFVVVVAFLLYDVRDDAIRRSKGIFYIFIGLVYLFCLIEFKIQFKKPQLIYRLFFILMYAENFTMVFIWWFKELQEVESDWWYRYVFYMIVGCSLLSMLSMFFYIKILKPPKVVVETLILNDN